MPLLDHFHRPIHPLYPWESFHSAWANAIMERLNQLLPARYFATVHVHLGRQVEADVVEFERHSPPPESLNGPGSVSTATWAPPTATAVLDAVYPDSIEVRVIDERDDARVVAVVELVSPGNKDRPESREAFAIKSAAYLQRGVGLLVIDIVTDRQADLYAQLLQLLGAPVAAGQLPDPPLHAAAYRPTRRDERNQIEVWLSPLAVGEALPELPLPLRGGLVVPVDLEATYTTARTRSRL